MNMQIRQDTNLIVLSECMSIYISIEQPEYLDASLHDSTLDFRRRANHWRIQGVPIRTCPHPVSHWDLPPLAGKKNLHGLMGIGQFIVQVKLLYLLSPNSFSEVTRNSAIAASRATHLCNMQWRG